MGILEKIGLSRKSKLFERPGDGALIGVEGSKQTYWAKWTTLALFLALLIGIFPRSSFIEPSYKVGEPWRYDDLTAPFTFSLVKDRDELESERRSIREFTPPVFHIDNEATDRIYSRLDSLYSELVPIMEQYVMYRGAPAGSAAQSRDSLLYMQLRSGFKVQIDERGWYALAGDYFRLRSGRNGRAWIGTELKMALEVTASRVMDEGLIDRIPDDLSNEIIVRNLRNRTERTLTRSLVHDASSARELVAISLNRSLSENLLTAAIAMYDHISQPNLLYNQTDTQTLLEEAMAGISPTASAVAAGQVIIRKGDIITRERMNMLQSLASARAERASRFEVWQQYVGQSLVIFAIVLVFFLYIFLYRRPIFDNNAMFILVFLSLSLVLGASAFVAQIQNVSAFIVPLAIAPILLTVIFDSRVGLLATLTIALLAGMMNGNDFEFVAATVTACSIAVFSVRDIKSRSQFFVITPALVFLAYALVNTGFSMIRLGEWIALGNQVVYIFINAILIILTPPLILLFEKVFRVTTDLTLFELSETNKPVLKTLMMRSPGTFHHSLQVANLSEAAALAIGANALLVRVGALYHDIGKMERPEFFVENQTGSNEHDHIKANVSAIVIKSHVANGVKMAEEEKLPNIVIDFIKTHHGNSLIRYFHEKAKEESDDPDSISEADFRYDGPLPTTRETGILLLADSVEASARTISNPSFSNLESHIERIVDEKLHEGQLNECPLTFEDLKRIKQAFLTILVGVYHSRVRYPGQSNDEKSEYNSETDDQKLTNSTHSSVQSDRETAG
jgi:putative nucleotidyltransferase with HDIG domain